MISQQKAKWTTTTESVPEVKNVCTRVTKWIEERVAKPVETWVYKQEQLCRKVKCRGLFSCLRRWFCLGVTMVVKTVTWIVVTVIKTVVYIVCRPMPQTRDHTLS